jgi:PAS domain S-box-containing protein
LIRVTGNKVAWLLITAAIVLMAARGSITMFRFASRNLAYQPELAAESVALVISVLMVGGIALIAQLFRSITSSEEALRKSEVQFRSVVESATDGIMIADSSGNIVSWNRGAKGIFDYTAEEVLGKPAFILSPERLRDANNVAFEKAHSTGGLRDGGPTVQHLGRRKDGSEIPLEVSLSMWKVNEEPYYTAVMRDISERKRAEEQIMRQGTLLNGINRVLRESLACEAEAEVAHVCLAVARELTSSKFGFIGEVNQAGRFDTLVLDDPGWDACRIPESSRPLMIRDMEIRGIWGVALQKGCSVIANDPGSHPDRVGIPEAHSPLSSFMGVPLKHSGKTVGLIGLGNKESGYCCEDQEAVEALAASFAEALVRKRAEEEAIRSARFLENVFETSSDGIVVTDPEGNITVVNDALEKLTGYSRDDLLGKHTRVFAVSGDGSGSMISRVCDELRDGKRVDGRQTTWKIADGQHVSVELNASPLTDKGGKVVGTVSFVRDVTDKKKAEATLRQSEKLKALGELAGGVAHDFNNILAAILGRAQLLRTYAEAPSGIQKRTQLAHTLSEELEIIEGAARDGAETVRRIQEFARQRAEDTEFRPVDLNELVNRSLEFTKVRWKNEAEAKGIEIHIEKELTPAPLVRGCPAELREVFTNLINNAVDAMPQGGQVRIKTSSEDGCVSIKIEDTGTGIPKEIRDRIFDPFFTTKGPEATGLGMSVSYGIIKRHGGTISIDSSEGQGTAFTIGLPVSRTAGDAEQLQLTQRESRKASVLVIEDEESVRDLLSDILIGGGHEVETAADGDEGAAIFERKDFDLVFTDLGMAGMSGWQVAERIKSINARVPVALVTGWGLELDEAELREKWVDMVVRKPFDMDQVLRAVQEGMALREQLRVA